MRIEIKEVLTRRQLSVKIKAFKELFGTEPTVCIEIAGAELAINNRYENQFSIVYGGECHTFSYEDPKIWVLKI